jgi:hypothetical protein
LKFLQNVGKTELLQVSLNQLDQVLLDVFPNLSRYKLKLLLVFDEVVVI